MMGSALAHYEGIKAFSETDQAEDLRSITVPTLVMQGDDDQVVPYAGAAPKQVELLTNGTLKIYKGYPHGMLTTHADELNADLRSEEHTSELQSLIRISYAVFCLKKKIYTKHFVNNYIRHIT